MKINKNKFYVFLLNFCCLGFSVLVLLETFSIKSESSFSVFDIGASAENGYSETNPVAIKQVESNKEEQKAVLAESSSVAIGKISEKYITPYTANTAYNNIYLKNSTDLNINLKSLFESNLCFNLIRDSSPEILILHTHATETYMRENKNFYTAEDNSRTTDNNYNMVAIGEIVANKLNSAGFSTLHDKTLHDYPSYNESYLNSAKTICSYLEKYPSIKIVIDLHRDSLETEDKEKIKLTKEIGGKKAAQLMLVMGSQSGKTKNFQNYEENLKLAVKIQSKLESMYNGLARSLSLTSKNYNESLTNGSVLIEVGTDANTFDEAAYSAELLGNALSELFKTL